MDTTLFMAYAGLASDMRAVEVSANNLANVNTTGYREERSFVTALEAAGFDYPRVGGTVTNDQPGPFVATGRDLDVAIEGDGYLVVQTPQGRRYTRDGGMNVSEDGVLVNRSGAPVLGQGGEIRLSPGHVEIDGEGRVMVDGVAAGRLLVVRLPEEGVVREGFGLYRLERGTERASSEDRLRHGFLEKSNVDLPSGNLSTLARHFQTLGRAIQVANGLEQKLMTAARG
jgi:flagellar basal body rod protein FlgG